MSTSKPGVLLLDPIDVSPGDVSHLPEDDLFLATCLAPLADYFEIRTNDVTADRLDAHGWSNVRRLRHFPLLRRSPKLNAVVRSITTQVDRRVTDVVFTAFEEIPTLGFMWANPKLRCHLIFHNNLSIERFNNHKNLYPRLMSEIFIRASSLLVPSEFQVDLIRRISPEIDSEKIVIKPHHQLGYRRKIVPIQERKPEIVFIGPVGNTKPVKPLIDLISLDTARRFTYLLRRMEGLTGSERYFLESQPNVNFATSATSSAEYERELSTASYLIATHNHLFEGKLSGPIADAISFGTPVICRRMEPHVELFVRYGEMGTLSDYATGEWCRRLLTSDFQSVAGSWQLSMEKCREDSSIEAQRTLFKNRFEIDV